MRILEDFETIPIPESTKFHLEIRECPMKYEFLRRPSTIFTSDKSFLQKEYVKSSHDTFIQDYFHFQSNVPYKDQYGRELRLKSRLHWTFAPSLEAVTSIKGKKISDFLLKSDPKLGGVLLYSMKVKIWHNDEDDVTWKQWMIYKMNHSLIWNTRLIFTWLILQNFPCSDSQIGYFIFAILSECDLHFQVPNSTNKLNQSKGHYKIIFKPKNTYSHYGKPIVFYLIRFSTRLEIFFFLDYLSINKQQSFKVLLFDSRSDFLTWYSALRWAKFNHDLTLAFHNHHQILDKNYQPSLSSKSFKSKLRGMNFNKLWIHLYMV